MAVGVGGTERWVLTALFAVLAAWYLADAAWSARDQAAGRSRRATGSVLRAAMSAAMISMFWSWGTDVPVIAQVTAFTAAAGWFAGQAVFGAGGQRSAGCHRNWYHAGMMAVMVWMAVAMPLHAAPTPGVPMAGMSGMAMPGGDMAGMAMDGAATVAGSVMSLPAAGSPGWVGVASVALAVALFAAAAWQVFAVIRPLAVAQPGVQSAGSAGLATAAGNGAGALAAAAMAIALLALA